jgi:hypothetical protein
MPEKMSYRNQDIQVRKRRDGGEELRINDKPIDVKPDPTYPDWLRSDYAFQPAPTLEELGRIIVDTQRSLAEPLLEGITPEKEGE